MSEAIGGAQETVNRPPFLLRLYAFLTFPFSAEESAVWWWRMHQDTHAEPHRRCPYCPEAGRKRP